MRITELLVTGYDGDRVVFTTDLTPETAETILTAVSPDGDVVVEAISAERTRAFGAVLDTMTELAACARIGA